MIKSLTLSFIVCSFLIAHSDINDIETQTTFVGEGKIKQENTQDLVQTLDAENGINISDDSLSIRGVGENDRGISVVDDGVSQTDVSGAFTFDIDTTDLEKLVVYKGPGSIYSVNGTGGVVKADSKSIFKTVNDLKMTYGSYGYEFLKSNLKYYLDLNNVVGLTYTMKNSDNDYKEHAQKESDRYVFNYGHIIDDDSSIDFSYKYYDDKQNKIQTITQEDYDVYLSGETIPNDGIWVYNKQDIQSNILDGNYKKYFGNDLLKISSFFKFFDKQQYQDGKIKIYDGNYNIGFDTEYEFTRGDSNYLFGFSYKKDVGEDNNQYMYGDIDTTVLNGTTSRVDDVNSDALGDILATSSTDNNLFAIYAKDELLLNDFTKLELSLRVDHVEFNVENSSFWKYTAGKYQDIPDIIDEVTTRNFLYTPKAMLTFKIDNNTNIFATIGHGQQTLSDSEILANIQNDMPTDIDIEKATNYELGLKHSSNDYLISLSSYKTYLENEIIEVKDTSINVKYFESAGETEKFGVDLSAKYNILDDFYIGANYSYSDYEYVKYDTGTDDYSGNKMEGIPDHKYSFFSGFKDIPNKINGKIEFLSSSSYYTDSANTIKYKGYDFVTNLVANWEPVFNHKLTLNVNNLFDKRYATSALTTTDTVYTVGAPRTIMLTYKYNF